MNTLLQAVAANQRFLGKTNPTMTAAVADGGTINDRVYIQAAARQIVDMGHWSNLMFWGDSGLVKLRNSGGVDYVSKVYDITANGNNAAQTAEANQPFITSSVIEFDGSADYLTVTHNTNLNPGTGDFSGMAYVYVDTLKETFIFNKRVNGIGDTNGWFFRLNTTGTPAYLYSNILIDTSSETLIQTNTNNGDLSLSAYYMVSFSIDRDGNMYLYVNGVVKNSVDITAKTSAISSTENLLIGNDNRGTYYYDGRLADLRLYNRYITEAEWLKIFNATKSRYGL